MIDIDTRADIAIKILDKVLDIKPDTIKRCTNGYCHSVYYVEKNTNKFVLRITSEENKEYYHGSIKWLTALLALGIPVPKVLKHGMYGDIFYNLISFINGKDLGEVYQTLDDFQKRDIVRDLSAIQNKVSALPAAALYGYNSHPSWIGYLKSSINRSYGRIKQHNVFDVSVCDEVSIIMQNLSEYFLKIKPIPFLDDVTTKNVLINDGKLSGIVDVDEMCYGDSLAVIGLTNMALLSMEADTKYINFWLDEIHADITQRKAVLFYTLLYCIDFMGEQGMQFNNDTIISVNQEKVDLLSTIYKNLVNTV